jgi:hypothetical protein
VKQELDLVVVEEPSHLVLPLVVVELRSVTVPARNQVRRRGLGPPVRAVGTVLAWVIGASTAAAQTPFPAADPLAVSARDRGLAATFAILLGPDRPEDWGRGFELARALGRAGLPLLAELAERENADVRRRVLLLAAAAVGAEDGADRHLLAVAGRARSGGAAVKERFAACFAIALGGPRDAPAPLVVELAERRGLTALEQVAIAVAWARFPGGPPPPDRWYQDQDPAVAAAAAFARPARDPRWLAAWLVRDLPHADLVRRGQLLGGGAPGAGPESAARLADWLGRGGADARPLREAVAVHLAAGVDPGAWLAPGRLPIDDDLIHILAAEPDLRALLFTAGRLGPAPSRLPGRARLRTAVAFALATDLAGWRERAAGHAADPEVASVLCLALAWRFLREAPPSADGLAEWLRGLPDVREAEWVRYAAGARLEAPSRSMPDERLDRVFLLAVGAPDRLPTEVLADELEDALWRAGAHPAATRHEIELELLRDLLLSGSTHGSAAQALGTDPRGRHLPKGIPAGDPVFEILYELYRFVRAPAPRRPAWARLR